MQHPHIVPLLDSGEAPRFSRSGTEHFFVSGGALTVVPVLPGPSFDVGAPRVLFPVEGYARAANREQYDVARVTIGFS